MRSLYCRVAQVLINNVHTNEQSLRLQLVLQVHIHQPVQQHRSHMGCDIRLLLEVLGVRVAILRQVGQIRHDFLKIQMFLFSFGFHSRVFDGTNWRALDLLVRFSQTHGGLVLSLLVGGGTPGGALLGGVLHEFHINYL